MKFRLHKAGSCEDIDVPQIFQGAKVVIRGDETYTVLHDGSEAHGYKFFQLVEPELIWALAPENKTDVVD